MKNILVFIIILAFIGCGSKEKEQKGEGLKKTFSTPFQGTIEAEEMVGSAIIKKKIKYTVSKNLIKRESTFKNRLNDEVNGIICDLNLNEITLYRTNGEKKFYVKLKVDEYLILRESLLGSTDLVDQVFENLPFGTIFADLPQKGEYTLVKNEIIIDTYNCKESEIKHLNIHLIIDHCEEIVIDKNLLELVEMGYPEKISGMAINVIKKYSAVQNKEKEKDKEKNEDKFGLVIHKVETIATKIKSVLSFKFSIKKIIEKTIDDIEFKLGVDFIESKTFHEMIENTNIEGSGDIDWD